MLRLRLKPRAYREHGISAFCLFCAGYLYFFMNIPPFSLFSDNCLSPCIQKLCPPLPVSQCILSSSELLFRSVDMTTAAMNMQMFVKLTKPCTYSKYQSQFTLQSSSQQNFGTSRAIFKLFEHYITLSHNPTTNSQGVNISL